MNKIIDDDKNGNLTSYNISGIAGSGKTHIIKALVMYFKDEIQCTSFQGVAAGLIHGKTIHEFCGMKIDGTVAPEK